jgi:hypothetical protein
MATGQVADVVGHHFIWQQQELVFKWPLQSNRFAFIAAGLHIKTNYCAATETVFVSH